MVLVRWHDLRFVVERSIEHVFGEVFFVVLILVEVLEFELEGFVLVGWLHVVLNGPLGYMDDRQLHALQRRLGFGLRPANHLGELG
jgi:hypothetical protein